MTARPGSHGIRANIRARPKRPSPAATQNPWAYYRTDTLKLAGTELVGDQRVERHDDARQGQEHRDEDAGTDRNGRQIVRADPAGHHGIDKTGGDLGHLGNHHGVARRSSADDSVRQVRRGGAEVAEGMTRHLLQKRNARF